MGGYRIHFFNPISFSSFQSPIGQAPSFGPSSIYYGLLMTITANNYQPYIIRPSVTSGTSASIKAYYLDYGSYYGVLILNKDTNPSASGKVEVRMRDPSGLNCMYLSADSLSSTNMTLGNYTFASGNAAPQGTFPKVEILQNPGS